MIQLSDYQDLKVWQEAIDLTAEAYQLVKLLL